MSACNRRLIEEVRLDDGVYAKVASSKYSYEQCGVACTQANLVRRTHRDGRVAHVLQCTGCGRQIDSVSKTYAEQLRADGAQIGEWDEHLAGTMDRLSEQQRNEAISKFAAQKAERRAQYQEYITSPEWFAKRSTVIERDRFRCQGCLRSVSMQSAHVHHKTYDHLGDELLFELVTLCRVCHEKIHPHMREDES